MGSLEKAIYLASSNDVMAAAASTDSGVRGVRQANEGHTHAHSDILNNTHFCTQLVYWYSSNLAYFPSPFLALLLWLLSGLDL